jgi:hypothetical protein
LRTAENMAELWAAANKYPMTSRRWNELANRWKAVRKWSNCV